MKPFIKWVGGKTQIIEDVLGSFPGTRIEGNYHELFVGGGSVLLTVLERGLVSGKVYAYDLNPSLIQLYKDIQVRPGQVRTILEQLFRAYETDESRESYYYTIRKRFNSEPMGCTRSAMFIFLNKTGFRGLFREGPNGFNVPFGHYAKPPVVGDELERVSTLIQNVEFRSCDFRQAFEYVRPGDFVYLDPPYAPETKTSFVGYTKKGFGMEDHTDLFRLLKESGVWFSMSNANVPFVREAFTVEEGFTTKELCARRSINSKDPGKTTSEVIVSTTYRSH